MTIGPIAGRVRRFGSDVNTDYIISSSRKKETLDESVLARYLLEAIDPEFAGSVRPGDILVADRNFGCGSAMEIAATVILVAGIRAVLATSFARTFYRNAINNGLLPIECDTASFREGDAITIRLDANLADVTNERTGDVIETTRMPDAMLQIYASGGLVPYLRRHGAFPR